MAEVLLDIKIGTDNSQQATLYKSIECHFELHQEKLFKINQQLAHLLNKAVTPLIIVEYPPGWKDQRELFNWKEKDYEAGWVHKGERAYQWANPRDKETVKLVKNAEKEFAKLTKLNNNLTAKLQLYDPSNVETKQSPLALLNRSKFKLSLKTSPQLFQTLTQVIRRISNQFLSSPIMAFLELLQTFTCKQIQMEKVEEWPEDLKQTIESLMSLNGWTRKQALDDFGKCKGDITIHLTLPKLVSIKIKTESVALAAYLAAFS